MEVISQQRTNPEVSHEDKGLSSLLCFVRLSGELRRVPAGEALYREGDVPVSLFYIERGTMELLVRSTRREISLQLAGPGDFLGLGATFSGRPHLHSAIARQDSEVVAISRPELLEFLRDRADVFNTVLRLLSYDVEHTQEVLRRVGMAERPH